jgi:hypothetical protein
VLRRMLGALPKNPEVISTDKGNEWVGPVDLLLDAKGIIRRTKDPRDVNALAAVDRAIQNLKQRLAESLSADPGEWASRIKEVTIASAASSSLSDALGWGWTLPKVRIASSLSLCSSSNGPNVSPIMSCNPPAA